MSDSGREFGQNTDEAIRRRNILNNARLNKHFQMLEDGYYWYCPPAEMAFDDFTLRVIADELDRVNKGWDAQVKKGVAVEPHVDAPSGIPVVWPQIWYADAPSQPGYYWFYGEPFMGQMGGHYTGSVQPVICLHSVKLQLVGGKLMAVVDGQFMPLNKWDGSRVGYYGKWAVASLPYASVKEALVCPERDAWQLQSDVSTQ